MGTKTVKFCDKCENDRKPPWYVVEIQGQQREFCLECTRTLQAYLKIFEIQLEETDPVIFGTELKMPGYLRAIL